MFGHRGHVTELGLANAEGVILLAVIDLDLPAVMGGTPPGPIKRIRRRIEKLQGVGYIRPLQGSASAAVGVGYIQPEFLDVPILYRPPPPEVRGLAESPVRGLAAAAGAWPALLVAIGAGEE